MSSKLLKGLVGAVSAFLKVEDSAERAYALNAAPVLRALWASCDDDAADTKSEWKKLNIATYRKLGVKRGETRYTRLSKLASMLFTVSVDAPEVFVDYCNGRYQSLQIVYNLARTGKATPTRKAATRKPLTFRGQVLRLLSHATPKQRAYVVKNIRQLVKLAAE